MNTILEILKFTIPSLVVGGLSYFIIKQFVDNEQKKMLLQLKTMQQKEAQKTINPLRLQAYERLALFLERMNPNSLVLRCYMPNMDMKLLQGVMTKNIRDEFEHNLSQQIYVSNEAWDLIKNAKEEMINLINSAAVTLKPNDDPSKLAEIVFQSINNRKTPADIALKFLKNEIKIYFE